jgi:hypothetical protein
MTDIPAIVPVAPRRDLPRLHPHHSLGSSARSCILIKHAYLPFRRGYRQERPCPAIQTSSVAHPQRSSSPHPA